MNMKQSCKALICAIEGELDGRHCTEEQAAAILDHALPSLTEALARAEAARDLLRDQCQSYISTGNEVLAERDTAQAKLADVLYILDQHRVWTGMGWEQLPVPVHAVEKIRSKLAQAEQQEAQGAQAGDEDAAFMVWAEREYQTAPDEELNLKHVDVIQNRKGWMARAALATQPAVPVSTESMNFEYADLSGERRTVTITRDEVIEGMEDALYEKLGDQICRCEPVGETHVVDCNCQDYIEQFTLVKPHSSLPKGSVYAVRGAEHDQ